MAKGSKKVSTVDNDLLKRIAEATDTIGMLYVPTANVVQFGDMVVQNAEMSNEQGVATRITDSGRAYLTSLSQPSSAPATAAHSFQIMKNVPLPKVKRGGRAGAPSKYPFEQMEVGDTFFVPKNEDMPDPLKTLSSTVNNVNSKYAVETGETKEVTRAKRGKRNKLELGADGNKIMETKRVPVYKQTRKFTVRSLKANEKYGDWQAPSDGVLVGREL